MQQVFDNTAEDNTPPKLVIDQFALSSDISRDEFDFVAHTSFGLGLTSLSSLDHFLLRPKKPQGTDPFVAFTVDLTGQLVQGAAGPYRQYFADVGKELQSETCPLFIPCPNSESHLMDASSRNKFTIKPSATSSLDLRMWDFLGMLFGICIRTGVKLGLDLAPFVWKPLSGVSLSRQDLFDIDRHTCEVLDIIKNCDERSFQEAIAENFTVSLSDRSVVDLIPNGSNQQVSFEERERYIDLVYERRLKEHELQIQTLRKGMGKIIPLQIINFLSWKELEVLVCGSSSISRELLKRHTVYGSGIDPSDEYIKWFWEIFDAWSDEERRKFIRFSWAQDRLPSSDEEFLRSHTRMMIKPLLATSSNPDTFLPRADTCFFNIELPKYSTKAVMQQRLSVAINETVSMNADDDNVLN